MAIWQTNDNKASQGEWTSCLLENVRLFTVFLKKLFRENDRIAQPSRILQRT